MILRKISQVFLINETEEGCYLSNGNGFVMEAAEVKKLAEDLVRFADKNAETLAAHNIEQDCCYESLFYSKGKRKEETKRAMPSCVYMFSCGGRFKVGISKDVERRRKELDNRPYPVEEFAVSEPIEDAWEQEQAIHKRLEKYRTSGEWYALPFDVACAVADDILCL